MEEKTIVTSCSDRSSVITPPTVNILSIPIYARDIPSAVTLLLDVLQRAENEPVRCVSATSAHGLVTARQDPQFAATLRQFWLNLPDGMPLVWMGHLKGATAMRRCYGPDLFAALMKATAPLSAVRHYLCGGRPGVAEDLRDVCARKFGNLHVVGTSSPPFRPLTAMEFRALGAEIDQAAAHVVWVGISTPRQERFALELARFTRARLIITVGAAFDFHTGRAKQAPLWMQQRGLEWAFRLFTEPRRLYRRYLTVVPWFLLYAAWELLREHSVACKG